MLSNATDFNSQVLTGKILKGEVVANQDPLHLGRIRVRISYLHPKEMLDEQIPWVMSFNFNSNPNSQGSAAVPDIGSICWVLFPSDDMYSGIYLGCLPNVQQELLEDYPNTYGFIDRSGSLLMANTAQDKYVFHHVSGTIIKIDCNGRMQIKVADDSMNASATSDLPQGLSLEILGNLDLKVSEKIKVQCKGIEVTNQESISVITKQFILSATSAVSFITNSLLKIISNTFKICGKSGSIETSGAASLLGGSTTVSGKSSLLCTSGGSSTYSGATTTLCGGTTSINNPPTAGKPAGWGGAGAVSGPSANVENPQVKLGSPPLIETEPRQRQAYQAKE